MRLASLTIEFAELLSGCRGELNPPSQTDAPRHSRCKPGSWLLAPGSWLLALAHALHRGRSEIEGLEILEAVGHQFAKVVGIRATSGGGQWARRCSMAGSRRMEVAVLAPCIHCIYALAVRP